MACLTPSWGSNPRPVEIKSLSCTYCSTEKIDISRVTHVQTRLIPHGSLTCKEDFYLTGHSHTKKIDTSRVTHTQRRLIPHGSHAVISHELLTCSFWWRHLGGWCFGCGGNWWLSKLVPQYTPTDGCLSAEKKEQKLWGFTKQAPWCCRPSICLL